MTYIGASTHKTALYYAMEFNLPSATVITNVQQLYGLGYGADILYVNDDGGPHNRSIVALLKVLEGCGVEVEWFGGVPEDLTA